MRISDWSSDVCSSDLLLRPLVVAGLVALGWHAPRGDRMRVCLAGLGLTTTVRMVERGHGPAADGRLDAAPAAGAGLAQLLGVVLDVAHLAGGDAGLGRDPGPRSEEATAGIQSPNGH